MHLSPQVASQLSELLGGGFPRDSVRPTDEAQPCVTSGFGTVMEQEHDLQSSTARCLVEDTGAHSEAIDRVLRQQHLRLGTNITLLEERYELLPHAARFQEPRQRIRPPAKTRYVRSTPDLMDVLPDLVRQHIALLGRIDALIDRSEVDSRGSLILRAMAQNHEEMACMLARLLKADETVRDRLPVPIVAATASLSTASESAWENEGGTLPSPLQPGRANTERSS